MTDDRREAAGAWDGAPSLSIHTEKRQVKLSVATTSEEPPTISAMCCVPRRWCERQPAPARLLWRD